MNKRIGFLIVAFVLVMVGVLLIYFSPSTHFEVKSNERALIRNGFSNEVDKENVLEPGSWFKFPWDKVYRYEVSEQKVEADFDVISSDAVLFKVTGVLRVRPIAAKIGELHDLTGPDYVDRLVLPEFRSSVRQLIQKMSGKEALQLTEEELERLVLEDLRPLLESNHLELIALLIRSKEHIPR